MKILKCPMCGASFEIKAKSPNVKCSYCDTFINVSEYLEQEPHIGFKFPEYKSSDSDSKKDIYINNINEKKDVVYNNIKILIYAPVVAVILFMISPFLYSFINFSVANLLFPILFIFTVVFIIKHSKATNDLQNAKMEFREYLKLKKRI